jgi:hypothetical protein
MSQYRSPGETFAGWTQLEAKACPDCGVLYAAPQRLFEDRLDNGGSWYCPNGHSLIFTETTEQKLKKERMRHEATRNLLRHEEKAHAATRGHLTRQKKRIANGVCPCCKRTFQNLSRHMKSQHPNFTEEAR